MGAAYTPDEWDAWTDRMRAEHGNGNGHGKSLAIEAQRLLPTPQTTDGATGHFESPACERGEHQVQLSNLAGDLCGRWGDYAAAIARWEAVTGRPAPHPTERGGKGGHRLSARFVEFLMGLPEGHVTDVPGMTRNVALKALGNGVVPQQCAAALRAFIEDESGAPGAPTAHPDRQLLPTPRATDGTKGGPNQRGSSGDLMLPSAVQAFIPEVSV